MADIKCNVWYTEKDNAGTVRKIAEELIQLDLDLVGCTDDTCATKEIYIGSGDMPEGYVLQIDPTGEPDGAPNHSCVYVGPGEPPDDYMIALDPTSEPEIIVRTVNRQAPDETGNIELEFNGGSGSSDTHLRLLREVVIPNIDNLDTTLYTQAPTFGDIIETDGIVFTIDERERWENYLAALTASGKALIPHVAYLDVTRAGTHSFCFNTDFKGDPFSCRELIIVSDVLTDSDTTDIGLSNTVSRITYTVSDNSVIKYDDWLKPYCELCLPIGDVNSSNSVPGLCHITLLGDNMGYMSSSSSVTDTLTTSGDAAKFKRFTATVSEEEQQSLEAFTAVNMFLVRNPNMNFKSGSKFRIYGR